MDTMKSCLLEQADTMRRVTAELPEEIQRARAALGRSFERYYLIGSGTSLNAALAVKPYLEQVTGKEAQVMAPFDFLHYFAKERVDERALVLAVSQTARSTGTVDCVKMARERGAGTMFITAEPENAGAQAAQVLLDTHTGSELVGPKTKGFTSTMAALFMLAAALGGKALTLDKAPQFLEEALARTGAAIGELTDMFAGAPSIKVISYGPCMAAAREGGLKVLETVRVPVEVYDIEEYMHGPYHCLEEDTYLIFLAPPGAGQARVGAMVRFAQTITPHILVVCDEKFVPEQGAACRTLVLPDLMGEAFSPLGYVVPLQWLAHDVTVRKGRKPEASRYPEFHKVLGSKVMPPINYYRG